MAGRYTSELLKERVGGYQDAEGSHKRGGYSDAE